MIKSGYNNLSESKNYIEFPSDSEAYEYAEDNGIDTNEIYFRGGYWRIDLPESPLNISTTKISKPKKTSLASKLGNYSEEGYIVSMETPGSQILYDTGIKTVPKSSDLSNSKVYFNKNDATNALKYMTSMWKYVHKVQIKNGKIIKIIK